MHHPQSSYKSTIISAKCYHRQILSASALTPSAATAAVSRYHKVSDARARPAKIQVVANLGRSRLPRVFINFRANGEMVCAMIRDFDGKL